MHLRFLALPGLRGLQVGEHLKSSTTHSASAQGQERERESDQPIEQQFATPSNARENSEIAEDGQLVH